jgi:hypothetical protein
MAIELDSGSLLMESAVVRRTGHRSRSLIEGIT